MERTVVAAQPHPLCATDQHTIELRSGSSWPSRRLPRGTARLRRHGRARGFRCCARTWSGGRPFLCLGHHQIKMENNDGPAQPRCPAIAYHRCSIVFVRWFNWICDSSVFFLEVLL